MTRPAFVPLAIELGRLFRQTRRAKGMTMREICEVTGMVQSTVSRLERGKSDTLTLETLLLFCVALEIEPKSCLPKLDQARELHEYFSARQPE